MENTMPETLTKERFKEIETEFAAELKEKLQELLNTKEYKELYQEIDAMQDKEQAEQIRGLVGAGIIAGLVEALASVPPDKKPTQPDSDDGDDGDDGDDDTSGEGEDDAPDKSPVLPQTGPGAARRKLKMKLSRQGGRSIMPTQNVVPVQNDFWAYGDQSEWDDVAVPIQNANPEGVNQYTSSGTPEEKKVRFSSIIDKATKSGKMSSLDVDAIKETGHAATIYPKRREVVVDGFKRFKLTQNEVERDVAPSQSSPWDGRGYGPTEAPGSEGEQVPKQTSSREDADEDGGKSIKSTDQLSEDDRLQHPDQPLSSETAPYRSKPTPTLSDEQAGHQFGGMV
jgi:hypothetical protein